MHRCFGQMHHTPIRNTSFIPLELACPDRRSSWCSHGLCVQHDSSVAAGKKVSPDVILKHILSTEVCWCTLKNRYINIHMKTKYRRISRSAYCYGVMLKSNVHPLTFLLCNDERLLRVQRIAISNRALCNDSEVVLPPRQQSGDSVLAAEDALSNRKPGSGAGISFKDDIMCSLIIVSSQVWGVIPLQGHSARDLLHQAEVLRRSREVWWKVSS